MLETLSKGFRTARLKLQGKAELSEDNIANALRDVRVSLLEADVELSVVKAFLDRVKARAVGEVVQLKATAEGRGILPGMKVTPADHFIKICHDELVGLMGPVDSTITYEGKPTLIMMVGLQGSGKTTTAGKLARRLKSEGKNPMLVAADIYRPAAIDQLMTIGRKLGVPVFSIKGMKPVDLCKAAVAQARNVGRDVVIFDTAGRLAIDNNLMTELEQIKATTNPANIFFVCDAMIGQDAVRTAAEFDRRLGFTGFILTKLDGDARGGAALSIKHITGKPIKFLGMGEGLDKLDEFRPEGLADRVLGFGDVVGLMKDFEQVVDQKTAENDARNMLQGNFTFADFQRQIKMIKQMGSLRNIFDKLPGMSEMFQNLPPEALDDRELLKVESMIQSMTKAERNDPDIFERSRMERVARGSGHTVDEVEGLLHRFLETRAMMAQLGQSGAFNGLIPGMGGGGGGPGAFSRDQKRKAGKMGIPGVGGMPGLGGGFPGMGGGFPGMGGGFPGFGGQPQLPAPPERPELSREERVANAKKKKDERKARRRGRD